MVDKLQLMLDIIQKRISSDKENLTRKKSSDTNIDSLFEEHNLLKGLGGGEIIDELMCSQLLDIADGHISGDKPKINTSLINSTRMTCLSISIQRHILTTIYKHAHHFPVHKLDQLLKKYTDDCTRLEEYGISVDPWCRYLTSLIQKQQQVRKPEGREENKPLRLVDSTEITGKREREWEEAINNREHNMEQVSMEIFQHVSSENIDSSIIEKKSKMANENEAVNETRSNSENGQHSQHPSQHPSLQTQANTGTSLEIVEPDIKIIKQISSLKQKLLPLETAEISTKAIQEITNEVVDFLRNAMDDTLSKSTDLFVELCKSCGIFKQKESVLLSIVSKFVTRDISHRYCTGFVQACILPKLEDLSTSATRSMLKIILAISNINPQAIIDGLLIPLLCQNEDKVSAGHCEIVSRISREALPKEKVVELLKGLVDEQNGCKVTEHTIPVFQNILNLKVPIGDVIISQLIKKLAQAVEISENRKSAKLATLFFALVSKYGEQCAKHIGQLEASIDKCTSFMAKSAKRTILKLKG